MGRYQKIPHDHRFCPFCPNIIENERHFIMDCPTYNDKRQLLFTSISACSPDFNTLNPINKFNYILREDNPYSVQVGKYIKECLHLRDSMLGT